MANTRSLRVPAACLLLAVACTPPPTTTESPDVAAVRLGGTVGHGNWYGAWQSTTAIHSADPDYDAVGDLEVRMRRGAPGQERGRPIGSLQLKGAYAGSSGDIEWIIEEDHSGQRVAGTTRMMLAVDGGSVLLPDLPAELEDRFAAGAEPIAPLALALGRHLHGVVGVVVTGPRDEALPSKEVTDEGGSKCAAVEFDCDARCTVGGVVVDVFVGKAGATGAIKLLKKVLKVKSDRKIRYTHHAADPNNPGETMPVNITIEVPATDAASKIKTAAAYVGGIAYASFMKIMEFTDYVDPAYYCKLVFCRQAGGGNATGDDGRSYKCDGDYWDDAGEEADGGLESSSTEETDIDCCSNPNGAFCEYAEECPADCWQGCYWDANGSCGDCESQCGYSGCSQGCNWSTGNCYEDEPVENCWEECYWNSWGYCGDCEYQCGYSGCSQGCNYNTGDCYEDSPPDPWECWDSCYWDGWGYCSDCAWECDFDGCSSGCDWYSGYCYEDLN